MNIFDLESLTWNFNVQYNFIYDYDIFNTKFN